MINKAQENIDTILKPNLREILEALAPKMRSDKNGIVVYNSYAPFFETDSEDCATNEQWTKPEWQAWEFWNLARNPLPLTAARRQRFNQLVDSINKAIREVVQEYQRCSNRAYDIAFSDWNLWPSAVNGQFCARGSTGEYPDPAQPDLLFFKPRTTKGVTIGKDTWLRRRDADGDEDDEDEDDDIDFALGLNHTSTKITTLDDDDIYSSVLYRSPSPNAAALHALNPRAPVTAASNLH